MKSTMNSISNNRGNTTILDRGVHSGQKVDVKGLPNVGKVIAADFENETVTVEIEVPVGKVLESE